ncbi:MAG: metallophosphoesterase [Clostridia bacterium]|nr:metallophosphoesterase [Clostridia bacterium]
MKDKFKDILHSKLSLSAYILSGIWLLLYFALGAAIFSKMWNTSPALPFFGAVLAFLPLVALVLNTALGRNRIVEILVICACPALALLYFFFFAFVLSKLNYFLIEGAPYFITAGLFAFVAFFVFAFPRLNKLFKRISAIGISVIIFIICLVCLFDATPFYISGGTTVFAVDDEYQIAFATSHKSIASVTVGDTVYYDQTNGQNNVSTLHKISVPASELESSREYSINTQGVILNYAYLPSNGIKIQKSYPFRPVDESDGLQIYNLSDTHECVSGPAHAGIWFNDKLDLLILNGDIINDVSSEYQISLIYKLAHSITGGKVPVIYTRGNHECNGKLANDFGKYVGCAERGFYYTYKAGSLSMVVLDTNNDMADDKALIRPIANFAEVRKQESEWLKNLDWQDGQYNFVIAHMAYPLSGYVSDNCHWSGWAKELISLTDGADLALCGHSHKTDYAEVGTWDNAIANYPVLRGSIRSNRYSDREGVSPAEFTGTAIEIKDGKINVKFTNTKKQILKEFNV